MGGITTIINEVKYIGIASLTIAILSVLILNLISTYSSSNIESNAEPVGNVSTLADIDPASISISISSYPSSSSTGGNNPNLSLSIPQGGGIATGRHTITVETGSDIIGYDLILSSNSEETNIVINGLSDSSDTTIAPTWGSPNIAPSQIANNTYGYTTQNVDNDNMLVYANVWYGLPPASKPNTIASVDLPLTDNTNTTISNVYWAVRVNNPESMLAGDYARNIVYTVLGELMPEPVVEDLVLNSSWTDTTPDTAYGSTSILTGQNLSGVTGVYIDLNDNETKDSGEEVTNLAHGTGDEASTKLTFTAPTYTQEGQKNVYLEWGGGGPIEIENGWNYVESSKCISGTVNTDCQVDIDPGMFAVYYAGDSWSLVNPRYIDDVVPDRAGDWYDYSAGKWANAITVRDDFEKGCYEIYDEAGNLNVSLITDPTQCSTGMYTPKDAYSAVQSYWTNQYNTVNYGHNEFTVYDDFILGYWVYVPRYSYEVMRRDAIDLVQQPEDFKIKFETASDAKKVPVEGCSNVNDPKSYRVGCGLNRTYTNAATDTTANAVAGTTWATHPAFTWMDADGNPVELNGIWVGKFETTGTRTAPTVKPNQHANVYEHIGEFYSAAKSIGQPDSANQYGGAKTDDTTNGLTPNSHHLTKATSHMLKNSEWGAVAYLSASKYGAGANKVQINAAFLASGSTDADGDKSQYGATGCGPDSNGVEGKYDAGTLDETTIESPTACGSVDRAYNGTIGQYASTTGNVYGVYDMSGGVWEYVMGNYSTNLSQTSNNPYNHGEVKTPIKPPYVDLYNITSNNSCTWNTSGSGCGGHALFETAGWGGDYSYFVDSSHPWFVRGGSADNWSDAGVFASDVYTGSLDIDSGFRVAIINP